MIQARSPVAFLFVLAAVVVVRAQPRNCELIESSRTLTGRHDVRGCVVGGGAAIVITVTSPLTLVLHNITWTGGSLVLQQAVPAHIHLEVHKSSFTQMAGSVLCVSSTAVGSVQNITLLATRVDIEALGGCALSFLGRFTTLFNVAVATELCTVELSHTSSTTEVVAIASVVHAAATSSLASISHVSVEVSASAMTADARGFPSIAVLFVHGLMQNINDVSVVHFTNIVRDSNVVVHDATDSIVGGFLSISWDAALSLRHFRIYFFHSNVTVTSGFGLNAAAAIVAQTSPGNVRAENVSIVSWGSRLKIEALGNIAALSIAGISNVSPLVVDLLTIHIEASTISLVRAVTRGSFATIGSAGTYASVESSELAVSRARVVACSSALYSAFSVLEHQALSRFSFDEGGFRATGLVIMQNCSTVVLESDFSTEMEGLHRSCLKSLPLVASSGEAGDLPSVLRSSTLSCLKLPSTEVEAERLFLSDTVDSLGAAVIVANAVTDATAGPYVDLKCPPRPMPRHILLGGEGVVESSSGRRMETTTDSASGTGTAVATLSATRGSSSATPSGGSGSVTWSPSLVRRVATPSRTTSASSGHPRPSDGSFTPATQEDAATTDDEGEPPTQEASLPPAPTESLIGGDRSVAPTPTSTAPQGNQGGSDVPQPPPPPRRRPVTPGVDQLHAIVTDPEHGEVIATSSTAALLISCAFADPPPSAVVVRANGIVRALECPLRDGDIAPSLVEMPLQTAVAQGRFALQTGALLLTTLVFIVGPSAAHALAWRFGASHLKGVPLNISARFSAFAMQYFTPTAAGVAALLLSRASGELAAITVSVLFIVIAAALVALLTRRLTSQFGAKAVSAGKVPRPSSFPSFPRFREEGEGAVGGAVGKMTFQDIAEGTHFVMAMSPFFDGARDISLLRTRLVALEGLAVSAAIAAVTCQGWIGCSATAVIVLIVCVVHLIFLLGVRPLREHLDTAFELCAAVLQLALAIIVVVINFRGHSSEGLDVAIGWLLLVMYALFILQTAVAVLSAAQAQLFAYPATNSCEGARPPLTLNGSSGSGNGDTSDAADEHPVMGMGMVPPPLLLQAGSHSIQEEERRHHHHHHLPANQHRRHNPLFNDLYIGGSESSA